LGTTTALPRPRWLGHHIRQSALSSEECRRLTGSHPL